MFFPFFVLAVVKKEFIYVPFAKRLLIKPRSTLAPAAIKAIKPAIVAVRAGANHI